MKIKQGKIILWSAAVLFCAARLIQLFTVIGEDGFFIQESTLQKAIAGSLYILMGLAAVSSLALRITRKNRYPAPAKMLCTPAVKWFACALAVLFAADGAVCLMLSDWWGVLSVLAAVYFVLLCLRTGREKLPMGFAAVFALAYPCVRLIRLFFDTFRSIKASENILEIVGLCAMVFLMIGLTKQMMNFEETLGKVAWCALVYAVFGTLLGPVRLLEVCLGKVTFSSAGDYATLALDIGLWLFAIVYYYICSRFEKNKDEESLNHEENAEDLCA